MKTIHKFPLNEIQDTVLPERAEVVSIQYQGDAIVIWAIVDADEEYGEKRRLKLIGTGWELPASFKYLATLQQPKTPFVWHIIEITK